MNRTPLIAAATLIAVASSAVIATARDRGDAPREGRNGPVMLLERFDANGDGAVTKEEMQATAATRFADSDSNGDGQLSADELTATAETRRAERLANRIARQIERNDTDGDGMLSLEETTAAAEGRRIEQMFDRLDADKDGSVTLAELEAAKTKGQRGHHGRARDRAHD